MKKAIMIICMLFGLFSTYASAQLKEVRGVQTRSVKYTEDENGKGVEKWGYELKNENDYDVWVEMELKTHDFDYCYDQHVREGIRDTKNITLKAGETYIWKCGDRMRFRCSGRYDDYHEKFYIGYKAYKKE